MAWWKNNSAEQTGMDVDNPNGAYRYYHQKLNQLRQPSSSHSYNNNSLSSMYDVDDGGFEACLSETVEAVNSKMSIGGSTNRLVVVAEGASAKLMPYSNNSNDNAMMRTVTRGGGGGGSSSSTADSLSLFSSAASNLEQPSTSSSAKQQQQSATYNADAKIDPFDFLSTPPDKHAPMDWSKELTEDQIAQYYDAFCFFDRDGSGTISTSEIAAVLNSIGQSTSEIEVREMLTLVDSNDSGSIDFPEFLKVMAQQRRKKELLKEVRNAFKIFDKDGNGFITAVELRQVMTNMLGEKMSDGEVEALIFEADLDGDGQINFDEFVQFMFGYFEDTKPG